MLKQNTDQQMRKGIVPVKIKDVVVNYYRIPSNEDRGDSIQDVACIEMPFVRIYTDNGLCGTGYTYTLGKGGKSISKFIEQDLRDLIIGEEINNIEKIWSKMWWGTHWVGRTGLSQLAIAAVDVALWDLLAKERDLPLYKLLGGYRDKVPTYGSDGGWLSWDIDKILEAMKKYIESGFKAVKMKVGKEDYLEDIKRVKAVREFIGDDIYLMVDANQKWNTAEAVKIGKLLEEYDLFWLEEPIIPDDRTGHIKISRHLDTQIALGESLYSKYDFKEYFIADAVGIVQADVLRVGGITEWIKIAHMAEAFDLKMAPHHIMELHLQLVAAVPNGLYVEYIPWLEEVIKNPLKPEDGILTLPQISGHGVLFDEDRLKDCSEEF